MLSIAAAKLGFDPVLGVDADRAAVEETDRNARANYVQVEVRRLDLRSEPVPVADVMAANLTARLCEAVAAGWARARRAAGRPDRIRLPARGRGPHRRGPGGRPASRSAAASSRATGPRSRRSSSHTAPHDPAGRGRALLRRPQHGDPNAFLDLYDPEIELFVPAWVSVDGGIFRGADAVNRWYANNFAQWSGQHWDVIELSENGPNVTFVLHWDGRGKRSDVPLAGRFFGVMSFQDGRIVSIVHLGDAGGRGSDLTTFHTKFLGCKVSQADAMLARTRLLEAGHVEAPEDEADLHVVNTCCITREAEAKSRQSVRRSANGRAGRRVVVTGCAANLNATQFDEIAPEVTALVGTADDVAAEVAGLAGPGCVDVETDVLARQPLSATRTRGFVKVQDGCDCHCSYCIIPKVRGGALARARRARCSTRCAGASRRASPRW